MLLYAMRRVQCRDCGVKVESVPWAMGKHSLTKATMLYLAHWARKLSWKETALSLGTTWCYARRYSGLADAGCPKDFSSRLEIEA